MAYCHECGEQIAKDDVFCPFCGITLQPVTVAGEDDDDSFSKTIAVSQTNLPSAQKDLTTAAKTPETPLAAKPVSHSSVDDWSDDKTGEYSINTGEEAEKSDSKNELVEGSPAGIETPAENKESQPAPLKSWEIEIPIGKIAESSKEIETSQPAELPETKEADAFADVPTPKILETLKPIPETAETGGACSQEKTPVQNVDSPDAKDLEEINLEPVFVSTEGEAVESEIDEFVAASIEDEKEPSSAAQTESSMMSYEEADVREVPSAEVPEKSADDEIAEIEDSEISQSNQVDTNDSSVKADEKADANSNEIPAVSEQPITIPSADLPEESQPVSRFDSVSIMEKPEAVEEISEDAKAENSPVGKTGEEPRSNTMPNIAGANDTGGKNKTKLKPLDEGTVLNNRYEIIRKIGGGGMGAVYLASDKNLGGVLRAVKEMVQSYIEDVQQEKAVNDFKRESLLLTSLDHQSIPTIYDYFFDETEARFYLVMKYISGGDLAGRLRSAPEGRIDETSVTQWAIQITDVLDYLHNRQPPIVYRDLKPANVMVDSNSGRAMLIDFGIARWVNKEEKGVTAVGTMGYAPPELFSGNVEARSDIYSLGSTMFHLLTGADPQSNPLLIFDFQKHPRPRQINSQLSDQMERILMRAVEYNADKRFTSAAEMRKSLEEHQENLKANKITYGVKEAPSPAALSDQPVFCGFCGQKIVATDMFCAFCGAKQPLAQKGVHSHSEGYAPAPLTAQLLIIGTNELEQPAFRLEKDDNLVGRRDPMSNIFPEVDLSKFDPQTKISRRHARIRREGNEFMVEDLGSSNGTYIVPVVSDTMRLQPHQPQLLTNGDKIRLGDTTLHFILG